VVGSAGNAENVEWLPGELGFDAAFDYPGGGVLDTLRDAAPDGVDVYFDNVGGEQLGAAIECMNPFGRIAACGMISQYNERTGGPANLPLVVGKRIRLQGFIVSDHADRAPAFLEHVGGLLRSGAVRYRETVVDGIEGAVQALLDVLEGGHHLGKMFDRLSPEEA
jgi:NADPH-dependent curcumin reductase CurA